MHCVIFRSEIGTVIHGWSSPTKLNGCDFTDACLHPGDHLSIGSVELELISRSADLFDQRSHYPSNQIALSSTPVIADSNSDGHTWGRSFSRSLQAVQTEAKRLEGNLKRQEGKLVELLQTNQVARCEINSGTRRSLSNEAIALELGLVRQRFELARQARLAAEKALAELAGTIAKEQQVNARIPRIAETCDDGPLQGQRTDFCNDLTVPCEKNHSRDASVGETRSLPQVGNGAAVDRAGANLGKRLPVERKQTEEEMSEYLQRLLQRVNKFSKYADEQSRD